VQDGGGDRDDSDERLAATCAADPAVFGALYDRYVDRVYRYCARRLPTVEAAEDATSQTFMEALRSIGRYRADRATFRTWLFAIAHHVVVDAVGVAHHRAVDRLRVIVRQEAETT